MGAPVQITFRDVKPSRAVSSHIGRRAAKLETFCDRMVKCHVVVKEPHRHSTQGGRYHVSVDMHVPGRELVVSSPTDAGKDDLHAAVDEVFGDAERVLEDYARRLAGAEKVHDRSPHGVVARVFHDRGYGFIEAERDGHEVYFHENSVLDARFDRVGVGTRVRFSEEDGDKGPQASTVHVVRPR